MNAEILKIRPQSGEFEEIYFDAFEDVLYVKFEDKNYYEYCGIFGGGFGDKSCLARCNDVTFIISHGQGYIFNINDRKIIHKSENDHLVSVVETEYKSYFVANDLTNIYVYDSKLIWSSKRLSIDGIKIDGTKGRMVYGKIYNMSEWINFSLNLATFEYLCDWQCDID
jgi:hypothetical protein